MSAPTAGRSICGESTGSCEASGRGPSADLSIPNQRRRGCSAFGDPVYPVETELFAGQLRPPFYSQPAFGGPVRRVFVLCVLAGAVVCPSVMQGQSPAPSTDLDRFMATALQRRDIDRNTLSDYVLDEAGLFEVLGPGRRPSRPGRAGGRRGAL